MEFGQAPTASESEKTSDDEVQAIGRLMIKPAQLLPLIAKLSVVGAGFQEHTGVDIGFSSLLEQRDGDSDEQ